MESYNSSLDFDPDLNCNIYCIPFKLTQSNTFDKRIIHSEPILHEKGIIRDIELLFRDLEAIIADMDLISQKTFWMIMVLISLGLISQSLFGNNGCTNYLLFVCGVFILGLIFVMIHWRKSQIPFVKVQAFWVLEQYESEFKEKGFTWYIPSTFPKMIGLCYAVPENYKRRVLMERYQGNNILRRFCCGDISASAIEEEMSEEFDEYCVPNDFSE